jgi:hypothetical protein
VTTEVVAGANIDGRGTRQNLIRQKGPSPKFLSSKGQRRGKQCQHQNTCICSCVSLLTGLLDYRYGLIVFREVRSGEPILTPGEANNNELRNAKNGRGGLATGRPDFFLVTRSPDWRILRRRPLIQRRRARLFIDASGWIRESGINGGAQNARIQRKRAARLPRRH